MLIAAALHKNVEHVIILIDSAPQVMPLTIDFPIGGFSPPEGRLARGCKPPAFSRFLFQSAVKSAESF